MAGDRDETLCVVDAFARSYADSLDKEFVEFLDAEAAYQLRWTLE